MPDSNDLETASALRCVRVFLASSSEFVEERERFASVLASIQQRDDLRRTVRLEAVLWETGAFGGDPVDINHAIARAVEFEALDLIVVLVGDRIDAGTAGEFWRAVELRRLHRAPEILVYRRRPRPGTDPARLRDVQRFAESVLETGIALTQ